MGVNPIRFAREMLFLTQTHVSHISQDLEEDKHSTQQPNITFQEMG